MISRQLSAAIVAVAALLPAYPRPVSAGESLAAMRRQQEAGALHTGLVLKGTAIRLAYTFYDKKRQPLVYAWNVTTGGTKGGPDTRGFVLSSADDEAFPVLGYADRSRWNDTVIPVQLREMMQYYGRQIEHARKNPQSGTPLDWGMLLKDSRRMIPPLVRTMWGQFAPYNDFCPMDGKERCVTGCVATAVAQILAYFQWPLQPKGTGEAMCGGKRHTLDLNGISFNYRLMTTVYNSHSSISQRQAVAMLMRAVGYAVNMKYSPTGSSASVRPSYMVEHFGYRPTARMIRRTSYSDKEWDDAIYESLEKGSPVIYSGFSNANRGHAFIIDGYHGLGYFHINWGWAGNSDGYYRLTALAPRQDSRNLIYNDGQDALTGLRPDRWK